MYKSQSCQVLVWFSVSSNIKFCAVIVNYQISDLFTFPLSMTISLFCILLAIETVASMLAILCAA